MPPLRADERQHLDALVSEHGLQKLQEYINETFSLRIIAVRRISTGNAYTWIDLDSFVDWLIKDSQRRPDRHSYTQSPSPTSTTSTPASTPGYSIGSVFSWVISSLWPWDDPASMSTPFELRLNNLENNQTMRVSVTPSMTVGQLKHRIEIDEGIPVRAQTICLGCRDLTNDRTLANARVRSNTVLNFMTTVRGGKPVIYLFSPRPVEATVRLSLTRNWSLSAIYPIVPIVNKDGGQTLEWKVQTRADGTLHELNTGLDVSYLFWEALTNKVVDSPPSSPVIGTAREVFRPGVTGVSNEDSVLLPAADVTPYLDKVLAALGLHIEARTSFITYWLPDMLKHTHVALRFLDQVAYAHAAPLDVSPEPDVMTRIFMLFRGVKEVELGEWEGTQAKAAEPAEMWREVVGVNLGETLDESLFRVIEWGGMEVFH